MGTATCGKYPGECKDEVCTLPGYMNIDAATYTSWGIDRYEHVEHSESLAFLQSR